MGDAGARIQSSFLGLVHLPGSSWAPVRCRAWAAKAVLGWCDESPERSASNPGLGTQLHHLPGDLAQVISIL